MFIWITYDKEPFFHVTSLFVLASQRMRPSQVPMSSHFHDHLEQAENVGFGLGSGLYAVSDCGQSYNVLSTYD